MPPLVSVAGASSQPTSPSSSSRDLPNRPLQKRALFALSLVLLTCFAPRLRRPLRATDPVDFNVYYTSALLVRQGKADQLYVGADTGADPQKAIASPGTPIFQAARSQGLGYVGLYVYPPLLADLLVPLTALDLPHAADLWFVANLVLVALSALLLSRLLGWRLLSLPTAVLLLSLFCFTPVLQAFHDGQITIVLLFLWTGALLLFQRGWLASAGAVFALAAGIKLTPALVLLCFLLWLRGRAVAGFLGACLAFTLLCLVLNTPYACGIYLHRVLPAMSGGIPFYSNYSLAASVERLAAILTLGSIGPFSTTLPSSAVLAGRLASAGLLLTLAVLIAVFGRRATRGDQVLVLGLLSLIAPILSPVSWFHAYAMAYIAFALLWHDCLQRPVPLLYLLSLTAVSLAIGSAVFENLLTFLVFTNHHPVFTAVLQCLQLLLAAAVLFYRLRTLRSWDAAPLPSRALVG